MKMGWEARILVNNWRIFWRICGRPGFGEYLDHNWENMWGSQFYGENMWGGQVFGENMWEARFLVRIRGEARFLVRICLEARFLVRICGEARFLVEGSDLSQLATAAHAGRTQLNLYRPSFSRPVSSPHLAVSNECNVLAGKQNFSR